MSYSAVSFRRTSWQRFVDMATRLLQVSSIRGKPSTCCTKSYLIIWPCESTINGVLLLPKLLVWAHPEIKSHRRARVPEYDTG